MKITLNNEFYKRLTTSLILIIILIAMFFLGNLGIYVMVVVLSYLSFLEIYKLKISKVKLQLHLPFIMLSYFVISETGILDLNNSVLLVIFYTLTSIYVIINLFENLNLHFSIVGFLINSTFFSIVYIITNQELEYKLIFIIIAIISLCDIFAYILGKRFGKFKIFPKISPNKTLEGYLGGTFCCLLLFVVILFYYNLIYLNWILYVIIIIISSFVGDLYISFFKRKLNIKDLGKLFPGHGGVLDRIDSWLFTFPLSFLLLQFN